ncbi:MAG: winged helix-turn-helix domain-containing protein [Thermoproteota archaeon]|nr:winged helix-turn-helix domain-containing protein [Thermoproteota archaeon]MDQ5875382.1 winged helix-turn-helix domain-containing protein [Thermoproteota archaeon]
MRNRSRPDIMAIILESANGGITKTKLLTRANLTSGQLKQYLDILITKKLVVQLADEQRRHLAYRTTEKGLRYLSIYFTLKSIAIFRQKEY